jgi:L-iditol 2-dehydrogenase
MKPSNTMKAVVLERPGEMSIRQIPLPVPGSGDLVIKVEATTTCGTDLKAYRRGHPMIPMPGGLGHEYSGIVVAVGENAPFEVGQAVMGVHSAPCQHCYWCVRNQENLCETIMKTMVLGSYSEFLLIPSRIAKLNVFEKPAELSFEEASLLEPLACVAQGIQLLPLRHDSSVLVIGPGAIGLMFVAALRQSGVSNVTLAGRNEARLAVGEALGAKAVPYHGTELSNFDIVVECTGQVEVWERSIDFVRLGGTLMLFGGCPGGTRVSFDTYRVHYDQISILSPFHFGTQAVRQAREWLLKPELDLTPLISGVRNLEEVEATFDDLSQSRGLKYVFRP